MDKFSSEPIPRYHRNYPSLDLRSTLNFRTYMVNPDGFEAGRYAIAYIDLRSQGVILATKIHNELP